MSTILTYLSLDENSVDQDKTAPIGAVFSESTLFVNEASEHHIGQNQLTFVVIGAGS